VGVDTRFKNEMAKFKSAADIKREEQQKAQAQADELQTLDLEITQKIGVLAQQQDPAMVNKRKLQAKLEELQALKDPEAIGPIKAGLQELENEIRVRDKTLEGLFNKQDKINQDLPGLQKIIGECEAVIRAMAAEIKIVEDWLAKKTPLAEIKVFGTIYAETMLKGNKAGLLLPETFDRVQIKEIKALGADKKMDLRFRITRLE
jgi:translation initiation factor 6 (eIF-6)